MIAANYTTVRNNFKDYCDRVTDGEETLIVTRKDEKNVVILSARRYNEMEKALRSSAGLFADNLAGLIPPGADENTARQERLRGQ
jgi:prevent-host-death family protein